VCDATAEHAAADAPGLATPPQTPSGAPGTKTPQRNFAKILESLRTVEDSFYFEVEGGPQAGRRVTVETAVMPLGWDSTGRNISFEPATIATPCAVVRKDYSGVFVQPLGAGGVAVNEERVESEQRLRDGDRLYLASQGTAELRKEPSLIFHEPATLAILDSLYRQRPPPAAAARTPKPKVDEGRAVETRSASRARASYARLFAPDRKFFGYFTLLELSMMCVATLVAAVIVFLVLIYLKPVR
jgi:hypothetical protein